MDSFPVHHASRVVCAASLSVEPVRLAVPECEEHDGLSLHPWIGPCSHKLLTAETNIYRLI